MILQLTWYVGADFICKGIAYDQLKTKHWDGNYIGCDEQLHWI